MKTLLILALAILFISQISTAQKLPPILSTTTYAKGIYMNFSEFINNSPSIDAGFEIVTQNSERKIETGVANYTLKLHSPLKKKIKLKDVWGVCDGKNIFINEYPNTSQYVFKEIQSIGRYCYFKGNPIYDRHTVFMVGGPLVIAAYELEPDWPFILNINNGKVFTLDKRLLEVILAKDSILQKQYEDQSAKRNYDTLFSYIHKYNARHIDEACLDKAIKPIDVVLYRTGKKELDQNFSIVVNGAVELELTNNFVYQYESDDLKLSVCIDQDCREIELTKNKINYIEFTWSNPAYRPQVMKVDKKVGEFNVNAAEHRALKSKK